MSFNGIQKGRSIGTRDQIEVDGAVASRQPKIYLMLNKPRGLVTTTVDEKGRDTVFRCFADANAPSAALGEKQDFPRAIRRRRLPRIFPVGRLDKASEGLLLFTNDTQWAARITSPETHLDKTYHVQIDCLADEITPRLHASRNARRRRFP